MCCALRLTVRLLPPSYSSRCPRARAFMVPIHLRLDGHEMSWTFQVEGVAVGFLERVLTSEPGAPAQSALTWDPSMDSRPHQDDIPRTTQEFSIPQFRYSGCHRSTWGGLCGCAVLLTLCWNWVVAAAGQFCPQPPFRSGSWCIATLCLYL